MDEDKQAARFAIFRARDALDYAEHEVMALDGLTPTVADALGRFQTAGGGDGQSVKLLFGTPGLSLTKVWFKSGYPLPLHAHDADCLYYITAGTVRVGREELGPGDGFFVGRDVPYTYVPGPDGVEVLEFRNADRFNIRFMSGSAKVWDKTVATLEARRADWVDELPPSRKPAETVA